MSVEDQKRAALRHILAAWDSAQVDGCSPEAIASIALFAALSDFVDRHGVEAVARFAETLPAAIRRGEFSLAAQPPGSNGEAP